LILQALYRQEAEIPKFSAFAKEVYRDMRAFASQQTQGNKNYFEVLADYQKQNENGSLRNLRVLPIAEVTPEVRVQQVYQATIAPTAPVLASSAERSVQEADSLKKAVMDTLSVQNKAQVIQSIVSDRSPALASGNHPETLMACQPDSSWKYFVARLCLLRTFQQGFQKKRLMDCPGFIPINEHLKNGKDFRTIGQSFANVTDADFKCLGQAILEPTTISMNGALREKFLQLSEFADTLQRNANFLKTYEELRKTINR
jgi:hypothetical protein